MITNLTSEQEALIPIIRDKWINQLFDLKKLQTPQLLRGIAWLYKFCSMEMPKVIICESILEAQLTLGYLKNANVGNNIRDNIGANISDNVSDNIEANIRDNIGANIRDSISDNIRDNIGANIGNNIGANIHYNVHDNVLHDIRKNVVANVGANVKDNVLRNIGVNIYDNVKECVSDLKTENLCYYGDISDYPWVAFYDFFAEIGAINNKDFNSFKKLLQSNYYSMIQMEKICVVIKNPQHILMNTQKQISSVEDYAFKFSDNTGMYFFNGIYLPDILFNQLVDKLYTFEDWTKETNEEIKSLVLAFYEEKFGGEFVADFLGSVLEKVDTYTHVKEDIHLKNTTKGVNLNIYTLFSGEIDGVSKISYVRCYCPSTDRIFFLGVDPKYNTAKDAIASLCQCPSLLLPFLIEIRRCGEIFNLIFDEKGQKLLNSSNVNIQDTVNLPGDKYFELITWEY